MMNRIKKVATIILKIMVFLYCFLAIKSIFGLFYWRMTHLSAEDLAWVKTIEQETSHSMFTSDTAPPLKLSIEHTYVHNNGNPFYISSSGKDVYEANAGYDYVLSGNGREIKGYLHIKRMVDIDSLTFNIRINNLISENPQDLFGFQPFETRRMEIRGKVFDDCICSDSIHWRSNPNHDKNDTLKVDSLIVSKKYGLIYFRYTDGTEYFRDF